ncbi:hypothetical protein FGO68_gene855 [Halteria grandinella]|uniref:Uncharacterized protein n=1 Tax=Halteria grandinella TaxID=5974 RepID=A0A8J8T8E4_HALGN|nr:hypothetical protein FGO68_gene855 [Halteria grandinella]
MSLHQKSTLDISLPAGEESSLFYLNDSSFLPYSPRASIQRNLGVDYLKISQHNLAMQIFSDELKPQVKEIVDQEPQPMPLKYIEKKPQCDLKKRQISIQQVYNSRRSTLVDKYIEQALQRGIPNAQKPSSTGLAQKLHIPLRQNVAQPQQQSKTSMRSSITSNYNSASASHKLLKPIHQVSQPVLQVINTAKPLTQMQPRASKPSLQTKQPRKSSDRNLRVSQNSSIHESSHVVLKNLNEAGSKGKLVSYASQKELEKSTKSNTRHRKSQSLLSEKQLPSKADSKSHIKFNLLEASSRNINPMKTLKRKTGKSINSQMRASRTQFLEDAEQKQPIDAQNLRKQMLILKQKMNSYVKEITPSSIQELMQLKTPQSKQQLRAGKCICLLLNSFYDYSSFRDYVFQNWLEIHCFLNFVNKNHNLMEEIELVKTKAEHSKSVRNTNMLEQLKKELKLNQVEIQQHMHETLKSPKIQNYLYKPIFGFIFYLLSFMALKKIHEQFNISRRSSLSTSRSLSKSPVLMSRQGGFMETTRRSTERQSFRLSESGGQQLPVLSDRSQSESLRHNQQQASQPKGNIANQILQTIERVFSSNKYPAKRLRKAGIQDKMYKKNDENKDPSLKYKRKDSRQSAANKDLEYCLSIGNLQLSKMMPDNVDICSQIEQFQILSPTSAFLNNSQGVQQQNSNYILAHQNTNGIINIQEVPYQNNGIIAADSQSKNFSIDKKNCSAFDISIQESPYPIQQQPPRPQELHVHYDNYQMNTVDWKMAESLKTSIEAHHNDSSIKVEDLISRVKYENDTISPSWPYINMRKRQSLVLEQTKSVNIGHNIHLQSTAPPQNLLEQAFEEFQQQQNIVLQKAGEFDQSQQTSDHLFLNQMRHEIISDQDKIIQLLKDRRRNAPSYLHSSLTSVQSDQSSVQQPGSDYGNMIKQIRQE